MQHYNTVMNPECLVLNRKGEIEELEKRKANTEEDSWREEN